MTNTEITQRLHALATSPALHPSDQSYAWEQLVKILGEPSSAGLKPIESDPVLDMEEAYKAYLETIVNRERASWATVDNPIGHTDRGLVALSKLDALRSTHPELFL